MDTPLDDLGAGEAAREMERVIQGLDTAHLLVAGMSQVVAAINMAAEPHYPPLRTVLEHAQASAERVMTYLRRTHP